MSRFAIVLIAVGVTLLVLLLVAGALVIATGSGSEKIDSTVGVAEQPAETLELPLASDPNALMLARRTGRILVGIAAVPRGPIEVAVVEGDEPIARERLEFLADGRPVDATGCGRACWHLDVDGAQTLVVNVPEAIRFDLPSSPRPSAQAVWRRANRTMNALRTYRYVESLTSGVGRVLASTFEAQAPNRLRFRTGDGFRSVIVGRSRWDNRGGRWERSPFPGLRVPDYMWAGAGNPRLLGRASRDGRPVDVVSVFDRRPIPAWFRLYVDSGGRVRDVEMLAPVHFMRQRFTAFNAPLVIEAPR